MLKNYDWDGDRFYNFALLIFVETRRTWLYASVKATLFVEGNFSVKFWKNLWNSTPRNTGDYKGTIKTRLWLPESTACLWILPETKTIIPVEKLTIITKKMAFRSPGLLEKWLANEVSGRISMSCRQFSNFRKFSMTLTKKVAGNCEWRPAIDEKLSVEKWNKV